MIRSHLIMPRQPLRLLPWMCALALTSTSMAWGPEGHRITGRIAEEYLSEQASVAIDELLGGRTLADVAVWADDVRQRDEYRWTAPLHYVNVPRDSRRVNLRRDCENGLCVVGAIHHFTEVLQNKDRKRSRTEQREALKFIVHFIGDIHQPMHVSYRDDRGGNLLRVTFMNETNTNLHRVWDTDMIRHRIGEGSWPQLANEIQATITEELLAEWGRARTPIEWANESLAITHRIYAELPRSGELGQAYYEHYIDDVLRRVAMAGVRMALQLNTAFADGLADAAGADTDPSNAESGKDSDSPMPAIVRQHLRIVEGDPCGRGEGRFVYLENTHASRTIRARIKRFWTTPAGEQSAEETIVVRPGKADRRRLGCSEQAAGRSDVRRFRWEIRDADFQ